MTDSCPFSIWIDADSCPVQVKDLVIRFAKRLNISVHFAANRLIPIHKDSLFTMHICDSSADAADNFIVENINENDLAVTRDIPLASRLVEKNICTLNDRGLVFTKENIKEKLAMRNFHLELYNNGIMPERTGVYGKKEINLFANSLDRELQKKLKQFSAQN